MEMQMIIETDKDLIEGKKQWELLGKQKHCDMSFDDVESHRIDLRKEADALMNQMMTGNLPEGPLANIEAMHQNLTFNILLGKREYEITGIHPAERGNN